MAWSDWLNPPHHKGWVERSQEPVEDWPGLPPFFNALVNTPEFWLKAAGRTAARGHELGHTIMDPLWEAFTVPMAELERRRAEEEAAAQQPAPDVPLTGDDVRQTDTQAGMTSLEMPLGKVYIPREPPVVRGLSCHQHL